MNYTREFEIDRDESLEYVFSLCSDAPYERESKKFGVYDEVLVISEDSVDFSRLNSGACAFLRDHDPEKVLGVIVKAWIDGNKVKCKVKFSDREDVQAVVRDIQAGIMTCTSVGYTIDKYHFSTENGKKTMYADRFMIYEGSLVGIPADISVGFNRSLDREEHEMQCNGPKEKPEEQKEKAEGTPEPACPGQKGSPCEEAEKKACGEQEKKSCEGECAKGPCEGTEGKACGEQEKKSCEEACEGGCAKGPCEEQEEIRSLGDLMECPELAEAFIREKRSYADFKVAVKEQKAKLNVKDTKKMNDNNKFSLRKALLNAVGRMSNEEASLERGVIEENKRKYGITDADIVVTKAQLRDFNGTEALNQTTYKPGMYAPVLRAPVTKDAVGTRKVAVAGQSISFSVATSGLNAGYVDINGEIPSATMDFTLKTMTPKKYGCFVDVSYQSLLQDDPSAEAVIMEDIGKALAQTADYAFFNGLSGSNQPVGLLNVAGVNTVPLSGAPTLSTALAFEKKIRESYDYSGDLKWVFGTDAYYKWAATPYSAQEQNKMLLDPDTRKCLGYDAFIDHNIPASAVILGNFGEALEANFDGISIRVVTEDKDLSRKQAIEIQAFAANDYVFRRPKSFCKSV